ncbi:MAG: MotA/TolQ/ExbB proton channel family protein [Pseudomonadota bacterium]|nr:MotA/TolQ/ExbB proton channel family protein [Pseudomonadota bacterium]
MEFLLKGGVVIWILTAYSVVGLSIVISGYLRLVAKPMPDFDHAPPQDPACEYGRIFNRLISAQQAGMDQASLRALARRLVEAHIRYFEKGLKTLSLLANTAPLLGLLGTIIGMISAFRVIESQGAGVNPQMLAGGIWEAMLTTGVGLAVALPLLLFLHFLESLIEKRHWQMYVAVSEVIHEPIENDRV